MNITLELQQLDDLIILHTKPPVTAILRNKLHPLREQMEAYIAAEAGRSERAAQVDVANEQLVRTNAQVVSDNAKLVAEITRRDSEDEKRFSGSPPNRSEGAEG